jgi:ribonuclease HI
LCLSGQKSRCPLPRSALNLKGAGAGVLLISPQGEQLKYVLQIHYKASNNSAEYEALIRGLRIVVSLGIKRLLAFGDSKVVIEQVNKEWDCVKDTMDAYCTKIRKLEGHFEGIEFQHVPRNNNVAADVLSKLGSRRALVPAGMFVQDLRKPSIKLLDPDNPKCFSFLPLDMLGGLAQNQLKGHPDLRTPSLTSTKPLTATSMLGRKGRQT